MCWKDVAGVSCFCEGCWAEYIKPLGRFGWLRLVPPDVLDEFRITEIETRGKRGDPRANPTTEEIWDAIKAEIQRRGKEGKP